MVPLKLKTEWDLSQLEKGGSFEKKRKAWKSATEKFIKKWKNRKDYLENPKILREALDEYEKWNRNYGVMPDEYYYFWLKTKIDKNNPELKAKFLKIHELNIEIGNDMSFFVLKISKIPKGKQNAFLKNKGLKEYKHFLEMLFKNAEHFLSEEEEKIMNLKSTGAYSMWVDMLSKFLSKEEAEIIDEKGKKVKKSLSEISPFLVSQKKKVRDKAAEAINEIVNKYLDVAESEINAVLLYKKTSDKLRNFDRADKSAHLSDDIGTEIVDSLIRAVSKRFYLPKRYYKLKARLLKLKKLEYYERGIPYGSVKKKYTYAQAIDLVYSSLDFH